MLKSFKTLTIWVKNLDKTVNKIDNTVSSMIDMKPKHAIKLDTVPLDKHCSRRNHTSQRLII